MNTEFFLNYDRNQVSLQSPVSPPAPLLTHTQQRNNHQAAFFVPGQSLVLSRYANNQHPHIRSNTHCSTPGRVSVAPCNPVQYLVTPSPVYTSAPPPLTSVHPFREATNVTSMKTPGAVHRFYSANSPPGFSRMPTVVTSHSKSVKSQPRLSSLFHPVVKLTADDNLKQFLPSYSSSQSHESELCNLGFIGPETRTYVKIHVPPKKVDQNPRPIYTVSAPTSNSSKMTPTGKHQEVAFHKSPAAAVLSVRDQIERKRKSEYKPIEINGAKQPTELIKVPRNAENGSVQNGQIVRSIKRAAPKETEVRPKPKQSANEVVCLSSDDDDDEKFSKTTSVVIESVNGSDRDANVNQMSEDLDETSKTDQRSAKEESVGVSRQTSLTDSCSSVSSVTLVQSPSVNSKTPVKFPDSSNFPILTRLNINPESAELAAEVIVPIKIVYFNKCQVIAVSQELEARFTCCQISLPHPNLFVHSAGLPQKFKVDCIKEIRFTNSTRFSAVLFHVCLPNLISTNYQELFASSNCNSAKSKAVPRPVSTLLLVLKSCKVELWEKLKMLFELMNFSKNNLQFAKESKDDVIQYFIDSADADHCKEHGFGSLKSGATILSKRPLIQKTLTSASSSASKQVVETETSNLCCYTRGKTTIPITRADMKYLNPDEFLNDTIIDFYCNYLLDKYLTTKEQQDRVYLFSSFFYKTYTQVKGQKVSAEGGAQHTSGVAVKMRRHEKVKRWTKNVDLFKKDFIFIPVNEDWHWFLVVICFPRNAVNASLQSALMVPGKTQQAVNTQSINVDKFVAERQPLIMVLNSLLGGSKTSSLFKLFKEYLEVEHESKSSLKGQLCKSAVMTSAPLVPQQTNSFDCGLYLLKYLEHFLQDFVVRSPTDDNFKILWENWFESSETSNMREELKSIIFELHQQRSKDGNLNVSSSDKAQTSSTSSVSS